MTKSGRRKKTIIMKSKVDRRIIPVPRRKAKSKNEKQLYELPESDIKKFIEKERRHDELDRINEVHEQKKMWRGILLACLFMNLVFICFAIIGANQ